MIRKLFLFSGVSFIVALCCLGGAAAIVTSDLEAHDWTWSAIKDGHNIHFSRGIDTKPEANVSKQLAFTPADALAFDVPADVEYTQGPTPSVVVTGPQSRVDRVRFDNGRFYYVDAPDHREVIHFHLRPGSFDVDSPSQQVRILITAPAVTRFDLAGDGNLKLVGYNQPKLDVSVSGDGSLRGEGETKAIKMSLSGDGDADLTGLRITDANVDVSGDGSATLAPTGKADISISGSGDVNLKTNPASLSTHVSGDGSVNQN